MTGRRATTARGALTCVALLGVAACAANRQSTDSPFDSGDGDTGRIVLEVRNLNFTDARLYAWRDGQRINLGTVTGKQDARFPLEWRYGQQIQIEINLLAGPTCTTDRMNAEPGDILELQIPVNFNAMVGCR